jgi:hypothetical protein
VDNKWLSRKFIAAMTALGSAHYLIQFGHIADGVYSAVVIATVAAYITGNVAQKAVGKPS